MQRQVGGLCNIPYRQHKKKAINTFSQRSTRLRKKTRLYLCSLIFSIEMFGHVRPLYSAVVKLKISFFLQRTLSSDFSFPPDYYTAKGRCTKAQHSNRTNEINMMHCLVLVWVTADLNSHYAMTSSW